MNEIWVLTIETATGIDIAKYTASGLLDAIQLALKDNYPIGNIIKIEKY